MFKHNLRAWAVLSLCLGLCLIVGDMAFAQMNNSDFALRDRNGVPIYDSIDMNDTLIINGQAYVAGPWYSPKQTCGRCHDYDAITRAYHFREGTGPTGENLDDHWSDREKDGTLYKYLANAYAHLESPGQYGAW